jgi:hypothetical protein
MAVVVLKAALLGAAAYSGASVQFQSKGSVGLAHEQLNLAATKASFSVAGDFVDEESKKKKESLQALLHSVKVGLRGSVNVDEVNVMLRDVMKSTEDFGDLLKRIDINSDGKFDGPELRSYFNATYKGIDEDDHDGMRADPPVLLATKETGDFWHNYECCGDFYSYKYLPSDDRGRYFKPRLELSGSVPSVKTCYVVMYVLNNMNCANYFYTNADPDDHVEGSSKVCRCLPWSAVHSTGVIDWTWYYSGIGNMLYYKS